jgi:hypothetical protein
MTAPDPTPDVQPEPAKGADQPQEPTPAEPKPTETVEFWKQQARKNEAQAKANADAAKKLKDIEDRDLSELERLQRDRDELSKKLPATELRAARFEVALDKGLPKELAARLQGSTVEEMAADADALLALMRPAVNTPRPDPAQGANTPPQSPDDAAYAAFRAVAFPTNNRK